MAKQKSTVEMVAKALSDKGYVVDDVELDKGVITVAALAPHGSTLLDSFKQTEARKWLDSVPDMSALDFEEELSIEEWEAQYGHLSDEDVAQALAPVVEEPVAVEAAPETLEGETNMETKVEEAGCKLCGELYPVGDLTDGVCPPCIIEAHRENAEPEDVSEALAHEDNLYSQYLSVRTEYFDENPDLAMVFEAMTFRRFLVVRYQTDLPDGTSITRERKLLPSHVYQAASTEGICVVAYDTYRKEVRTFRVDKFRACRLGECAPEANLPANNVAIFPAAYQHRCKPPRIIHEKSVKGAILNGWSTKPLPQVLVQ
jgi:hypothetical protein